MDNYTCNKCGAINVHTERIRINFSYGSKFDMEKWTLRLCDNCLKRLVEQCAYKPKGFGVNNFEKYWNVIGYNP